MTAPALTARDRSTPTVALGAPLLERLYERSATTPRAASRALDARLRASYDGDLVVPLRQDRPTLLSNFVETIDGAVALEPGGRSGGGDVSGFSRTDRFVMGLLRAMSDVVVVGAGTARASSGSGWTPGGAYRPAADAFEDLRAGLGLTPQPTTLIVTRRGELDPSLPAFRDEVGPIVIAASRSAAPQLRAAGFPAHVRVETLPGAMPLAQAVIGIARRLDARLVLSEAGPHVTAQLVRDGLVDELFVTLAPQLVGRDERTFRLALLEGQALWPASPTWGRLASVRRGGDHLFLRYRLTEDGS